MLKRLLTATAISALMASGALAQANPPTAAGSTPGASSTAGSGASSGASSSGPSTGTASAGQFIQSQRPDQFLASHFRGTDVIGQNDEKIGDVNDLLFDRQGKIEAVVVGVGGFLGIGEKDVALPMTAFQIVPADAGAGANTASRGGAAGGNTGSATTGGGGAGGSAGTAAGTAGSGTASNDPTNVRLKLSMTKDQLKGAPDFHQMRARGSSASDTGSGAATSGRSGSGAATGPTPRP